MKIALSGSGGTGKTVLSEEVSKKYGIPVIPEYARETAEEMGIKELRGMTAEQSYEFQMRILDRKIAEEAKYETFIADRCTADNVAYYLRWVARDLDDTKNSEYITRCVAHLDTYDKIVVLPWGMIPLEDDGFRSPRRFYQHSIQSLILGVYVQYNVDYITMPFSDMEDRVNSIGHWLTD